MGSLAARSQRLLDLTESELASRSWNLVFCREVEIRFEADTGSARCLRLVLAGLVTLLVYDLFIFNDRMLRPEALSTAIFLRLGVVTPYGLAALWSIHRGMLPWAREALMGSTVTVATTMSSIIFFASSSPYAVYDPFSFSLIFMAANTVFPLRFTSALLTSAANLLIAAAFILAYDHMPLELKLFAIVILAATAIFTVFANYRFEASERRSYLLLLRETLRAEGAQQTNKELTAMSNTDPLTKLANRRKFEEGYAKVWSAAARDARTIALLMIDIDNFKRYNDCFGHPEGDRCLFLVAEAMRTQMRGTDFIARFGGEEFVAVLEHVKVGEASRAAERIRKAVENLGIPHDGIDGQLVVTISIGVGEILPSSDVAPDQLIQIADKALYDAKRHGRNCSRCGSEELSQRPSNATSDGIST